MLTLNRKHQEDLQRRGLKPEQIEAQRYRSVPLFGMKKLVKRLAEEGYMVKGVPGFYRDTDGNWTINFKAENSRNPDSHSFFGRVHPGFSDPGRSCD